jgi:hypothetical protein
MSSLNHFALDESNVFDANRMALLCLMYDKANGLTKDAKTTITNHIKTLGYEPFNINDIDTMVYKMAIKLKIPRDQVKTSPEWLAEMGDTRVKEFGAMRLEQLQQFVKYPDLYKFYTFLTWGELAKLGYTQYY